MEGRPPGRPYLLARRLRVRKMGRSVLAAPHSCYTMRRVLLTSGVRDILGEEAGVHERSATALGHAWRTIARRRTAASYPRLPHCLPRRHRAHLRLECPDPLL